MTYDSVLTLIGVTYKTVPPGIEKEIKTKTDVYCQHKSVSCSDFYSARTEGLKPTLVFVVHAFEYSGERTVEYEGRSYSVVRTYETDNEEVELTVEETLGGAKKS